MPGRAQAPLQCPSSVRIDIPRDLGPLALATHALVSPVTWRQGAPKATTDDTAGGASAKGV